MIEPNEGLMKKTDEPIVVEQTFGFVAYTFGSDVRISGFFGLILCVVATKKGNILEYICFGKEIYLEILRVADL